MTKRNAVVIPRDGDVTTCETCGFTFAVSAGQAMAAEGGEAVTCLRCHGYDVTRCRSKVKRPKRSTQRKRSTR